MKKQILKIRKSYLVLIQLIVLFIFASCIEVTVKDTDGEEFAGATVCVVEAGESLDEQPDVCTLDESTGRIVRVTIEDPEGVATFPEFVKKSTKYFYTVKADGYEPVHSVLTTDSLGHKGVTVRIVEEEICPDQDQDGFLNHVCGGDDCNDTDPLINPDATETSDGIDDNCDGIIDDTDRDGLDDEFDNCDYIDNPGQADDDNDGVGDACDNCISKFNPNQFDYDEDGQGDVCENIDYIMIYIRDYNDDPIIGAEVCFKGYPWICKETDSPEAIHFYEYTPGASSQLEVTSTEVCFKEDPWTCQETDSPQKDHLYGFTPGASFQLKVTYPDNRVDDIIVKTNAQGGVLKKIRKMEAEVSYSESDMTLPRCLDKRNCFAGSKTTGNIYKTEDLGKIYTTMILLPPEVTGTTDVFPITHYLFYRRAGSKYYESRDGCETWNIKLDLSEESGCFLDTERFRCDEGGIECAVYTPCTDYRFRKTYDGTNWELVGQLNGFKPLTHNFSFRAHWGSEEIKFANDTVIYKTFDMPESVIDHSRSADCISDKACVIYDREDGKIYWTFDSGNSWEQRPFDYRTETAHPGSLTYDPSIRLINDKGMAVIFGKDTLIKSDNVFVTIDKGEHWNFILTNQWISAASSHSGDPTPFFCLDSERMCFLTGTQEYSGNRKIYRFFY